MDCGEGVEEVEAFDGAAGAVGVAIFVGEDEGRAAGAVDDARGENSEDAAMPGGVVEDDALGEKISRCGAQGFELGFDRLEGLGFGGAALVVEAVEFFCELGCAGRVFCEEEFDDVAGDVHAAGGVDAWGEAEADFGGGGGAVYGDLRDLHEGAQAGLDGVAKFAQAQSGDDAVLAFERDGVGDGSDGDELEEGGDEAALEADALGFGIFGGSGVRRGGVRGRV